MKFAHAIRDSGRKATIVLASKLPNQSCFRWLLDIIPRSLPFLPHPLSAYAQLRLLPDRPLDRPQSRLATLNTARKSRGSRSCLIPTLRRAADHLICLPSRRRRDRSDWRRSQRRFVTTPKSKRSSPCSDVRRAVVSSQCPTASRGEGVDLLEKGLGCTLPE